MITQSEGYREESESHMQDTGVSGQFADILCLQVEAPERQITITPKENSMS